MRRISKITGFRLLGVSSLLIVIACDSSVRHDDAFFTPPDATLARGEVPSFKEFADASRIQGDSREYYVVEGDYPISSREELWNYYQERFLGGSVTKSAVKTTPLTGTDTGQCNTANPSVTCVDDVYEAGEQRNLRYCVSDAFGANKAAIRDAMAEAAESWARVVNAMFVYVATDDDDCAEGDPVPTSVDFKVAPTTGFGGACAFWPRSGRACVADTLVYNVTTDFSPNTMTGVLRHELGHILGLHHEHMRADAASMACRALEMRYLTDYDANSIMGYPASWGGCAIGGGNDITESDALGARQLYHSPARWLPAYAFHAL